MWELPITSTNRDTIALRNWLVTSYASNEGSVATSSFRNVAGSVTLNA